MRQIIRRREVVADDWRYAGEDGKDGDVGGGALRSARIVQPLATFIESASSGSVPAGVRIGPADDIAALVPYLQQIALIVVDFPKNGEGRGFSQARLLRQRHGYRGELRAAGALWRDQLFMLARCGFDAFDLDPSENLAESLQALNTFSVAYQPGIDALVRPRERGAG